MKPLALIGVVLILLGVFSFVIPVPHRDDHSVRIGDSRIGVQTQHSEKVPLAVSVVLIGAGVLALVLGGKD